MTVCRRCGADIRWAETSDEVAGITRVKRIPIDNLPSYGKGPDRFRETGYDPLRVEPVPENQDGTAYKLHDCGR